MRRLPRLRLLALHLSQQNLTCTPSTSIAVAGFRACPESGHLRCLYCPVAASCSFAFVEYFAVSFLKAFGQFWQQK